MAIYVSGSLAFDRIMLMPGKFVDHILPEKLHILSVSFLIDKIVEKRGGTAGNIAYSMHLLGQKATILASVGRDFHNYASQLLGWGLTLEGVREVEEELTAGAYIITDNGGNQINGFCPAAMNFSCGYTFPANLGPNDMAIVGAGNMADMYELPLFSTPDSRFRPCPAKPCSRPLPAPACSSATTTKLNSSATP